MSTSIPGHSFDATMASVAGKTSVASGITAGLGGLAHNEIAAYGGFLIALLTGLMSWVYRRREARLALERHREILAVAEQDKQIRALQLEELRETARQRALQMPIAPIPKHQPPVDGN